MKVDRFFVGEGWGEALSLDPDSLAGEITSHLYREMIEVVRLVLPLQYWDGSRFSGAHAQVIKDRAKRAKELGVKIQLCLDIYNHSSNRGDYHRTGMTIPYNLPSAVANAIKVFGPASVQVGNEVYYSPVGSKMTPEWYADICRRVCWGLDMAQWDTSNLLVFDTTPSPGDRTGPEWTVNWPNCAEAFHSLIMHKLISAGQVENALLSLPHIRTGIGNVWPAYETEFTAVGTKVHINSRLGADMVRRALEVFKEYEVPFIWLDMVGFDRWMMEGGWGLRTSLVSSRGELSLGAQEMMDFIVVEDYIGKDTPRKLLLEGVALAQQADRGVGRPIRRRKVIKAIRLLQKALKELQDADH